MPVKTTEKELKKRLSELEHQNKLLQAEAMKYRTFFDSFPHGITVSDSHGNIIEANSTSEKLLGIDKEEHKKREIAGREWRIIRKDGTDMPSEEWASVTALKENRLVTGCEMGIVKPDGQITWINVTAAPLRLEGYGVVVTYNDITKNKQAEDALLRSERELQQTLDATTDGIWSWNFKTGQLFFSPRYYAMLGYAPGEFPAGYDAWADLLHPDDREKALAVARNYLETKPDIYENEFRLRTKSGEYRWIRTRAKVVERDENGNAEYMIGNHEDITERKRSEEALRTQNERQANILEGTNAGTWEWNVQTGETIFNERWAEIIGLKLEELSPVSIETWQQYAHPDDLKASDEMLQRHFNGELGYYDCECRMRHKNGHWVWVLDRGKVISWTDDGKPLWMFGTHTDITYLKQAEATLQESENRYRTLFERNLNPIAIIDRKGRYLDANTAFLALVEKSKQELLKMTVFDFSPTGGKAAQEKINVSAWETGGTVETEYFVNGKIKILELTITPMIYKDLDVVVGVGCDITERKSAEAALQKRAAQFLALHEISVEVTKPHAAPQILQKIVESATCLLEGTGGGMYLCDSQKGEVRCVVSYNTPRDFTGTVLKYGEGAAGTVAQTGKPIIIADYDAWNMRAHVFDEDRPFRSVMSAPLLWENDVIGVIHVLDNEIPGRFGKEDLDLLTLFANQAVIALQNAKMLDQITSQAEALRKRNEELTLEISGRKKAEKALRKNEEKFRFLAENIADILWTLDMNFNTTFVSSSIEKILGFTPEERYRQKLQEMITPQSIKKVQESFLKELRRDKEDAVDPDRFATVEVEYYHKDGSTVWMENRVRAIRSSSGEMVGIIGVSRDITERMRAEKLLKESEKKFRMVLESNPDPVIVYDMEGKVIYLNPAFEQVFGWTYEECVGKKMDHFVPEENWPETRMLIEKTTKSGESFSGVETRRYKKGGDIIPISISGSLLKDQEGKLTASVINLRDITKQKQMESQLQQSQKMEAIGTLAGGIAHDFNNMLAIILGNAELAIYDIPEWNPGYEKLNEIRSTCLRAKDVVQQLLAFSRKTQVIKQPIQIDSVVKDTLRLLRASIPSNIEIRLNIDKGIHAIMGDATQLNQILINLCTNARDSILGSGMVEVSLMNVESEKDKQKIYGGPYVKLMVRDTGSGISPKDINRIFDPYFTTKEFGKGSGLGLAVVHGIVKAHNGHIAVKSELGKGTTFEVFFPVTQEAPAVAAVSDEAVPKGSERVLFVDDEELMVKLNHELLEKLGYRVKSTTSALDALEMFRNKPDQFDLVITDMSMPKMTGDRLAQELLKVRPDIPIILCTGYSERISEEKAKELGIKALAYKPLELKRLSQTVRKILDNR